MTDPRVFKLLKKGCVGPEGLRDKLDLTAEESRFLESTGDLPIARKLTHDECIDWARESVKRASRDNVRKAFVWSLTSHELEYRPALGAFAQLHLLAEHSFVAMKKLRTPHCETCGAGKALSWTQQDFAVANYQRHKFGSVPDDLGHQAMELEWFVRLPAVSPSKDDWKTLRAILDAAGDAKSGKSVGALKKALKTIIKTNNYEADALLQALSCTGILATEKYPGFDKRYVRFADRGDLRGDSDQQYPLNCWEGPGYRAEAVRFWFPEIAAS